MNRAGLLPVKLHRAFPFVRLIWLGLVLAGLLLLPAMAEEKGGMPDLCQVDQTCLPTATANLIVWFGQHGYPKLIAEGDSKANGYIHTVHRIMAATDANFDWGTRPEKIASGIKEYVDGTGYNCEVEFRGLGKTPFTQDWLKENDEPNKGFVLLLSYVAVNRDNNTYSNAWNAGHAVTLVNALPDMILVHDPAHYEDETGRKILTPQVITKGNWVSREGDAPVAGLLLLSGSLLDAPPNSDVMLIGAICVTMRPQPDMIASSSPGATGSPVSNVGGGGGTTAPKPAATPTAPTSATKSWAEWIFDWLFSK